MPLNRREFLVSMAAAGIWGQQAWGSDVAPNYFRSSLDQTAPPAGRIVLKTSFEVGDTVVNAANHLIENTAARTGSHSLAAEVTELRQCPTVSIPFTMSQQGTLCITFWARSENGSGCSVNLKGSGAKMTLSQVHAIPTDRWICIESEYKAKKGERGIVEISAPNSWILDAPLGKVWLDDLLIREVPDAFTWPELAQDFPALATDAEGTVWLALLERNPRGPQVVVHSFSGDVVKRVAVLSVPACTGLEAPAITALKMGCMVAFPVEQNNRWQLAYAAVGSVEPLNIHISDFKPEVNINPALTSHNGVVHIVWEANPDGERAIFAAALKGAKLSRPKRLSPNGHNSYNPDIVATADGRLFAAWDAQTGDSVDIVGAWGDCGRWEPSKRLTSDGRIERHPNLAVCGGDVWMAWQAQAYDARWVEHTNEQRIVVARVAPSGLETPNGMFEAVSRKERFLVRPRITFDCAGTLYLTARQSEGMQSGWRALCWRYDGKQWSEPESIADVQGRWRPVDIVSGPDGMVAACHIDNLPNGWEQMGQYSPWDSGVLLVGVNCTPSTQSMVTEPLSMPETEFSVKTKMDLASACLPKATWKKRGTDLTLFWGNLHAHTDLSVCQRRSNPPGHDSFANERDIERMDFCVLTDHGYNFDPNQWELNQAQTRNNHDKGRFVTFLGQEWTSSANPPLDGETANRYGHHNLLFMDPYHSNFYDAFDGDISPTELWKEIKDTDFICIPHQLADWQGKGGGNPPTDWRHLDERLQPVAEIWQTRGSYEHLGCPRQAGAGAPFKQFYLQDAWAQDIVIGVVAAPDHPGGDGKAGVWAAELTREAIFEAIRARHTFGTSGAKMMMKFAANDAIMGDKIQRTPGAIRLSLDAQAMCAIRDVTIMRNNEVLYEAHPNADTIALEWEDSSPPDGTLWYYARIQAEDEELGWSSPIWFMA